MTQTIEKQLTDAFIYGRIYEIKDVLETHEALLLRLERFFEYFLDVISLEVDRNQTERFFSFYRKKLDEYSKHKRIVGLCKYYLEKQ
jgi:hypothetical protein